MNDDLMPAEDPDSHFNAHGVFDPDDTRYIPRDVPITQIVEDRTITRTFVTVEAFAEVQAERDDYRRAMALVNAHRLKEHPDDPVLAMLCAMVEMGDSDARAMNGLLEEVRRGAWRIGS